MAETPAVRPPVRPPVRPGWEDVYAKSLDCVHCGLCLTACPTYRETGRESSSPRGRIYLMRGVAESRIPLGEVVADEAHLCLGCRACETACPSGVQYGVMVERVREEVVNAGLRDGAAQRLERWALRHLVPHPGRLALLFDALALVQRLGIDRLARPLLPARLRDVHALLPRLPSRAARRARPSLVVAEGERRGRVGFLAGCVMQELFAGVNAASVRLLARNGYDVVQPESQGCCGALQAHAGDGETAKRLARGNVAAFAGAELDAVITNSAGCGAALRDVAHWLPGEGEAFAGRVRDVCEFLDAEGLRPPPGRVEARVCYDDPCHLLHGQGVGAAPRRCLAQVPGLTLVSHEDPEVCCGAAGTYNLTRPAMARALLERKIASLAAADPDVIATGNPGCLMQIAAGATAAGLRARVVHPIELLDEAYATSQR